MQFDFQSIQHCEFGIGRDLAGGAQEFVLVPADANVQTALREMAERTRAEMFGADANPPRYEPGEKHGSTEHQLFRLPIRWQLRCTGFMLQLTSQSMRRLLEILGRCSVILRASEIIKGVG